MSSAVLRNLAAVGIAARFLSHPSPAMAGVSSRLVYSRGADVSTCPDEVALRKAVADRLGYDPFVAYARNTVIAEVLRDAGKLVARARWVDESGILRGSRDLVSDNDDCSRLVAALALAISIALDPMTSATQPTEPPVPEAPGTDVSPAPAVTAVPAEFWVSAPPMIVPRNAGTSRQTPVPSPRVWEAHVGARAFASTGSLPSMSEGGAVFVRLIEAERVSFALEGQVELPTSAPAVGSGRVSAWSWGPALIPCWHLGPAGICAVGTFGQIRTHGEGIADPHSETALYAAVGPRGLLGFQVSKALRVELHGELLAPLVHNELSLNGIGVWRTPSLAGTLGVGVVGRVW